MTLRRYLQALRPHVGRLSVAGGLLALAAVLPPAAVWVLERALAKVLGGDLDGLAITAAVFAGLYVLHAVVSIARTMLTKQVAWQVASSLRRRLHATFLRDAAPGATGDRLAALTDEVDQVQYGISAGVTAVRDPLTLLGLGATAAVLDGPLALAAVALLAPVALAGWLGGRRVRHVSSRVRQARAALHGLAQEQLSGLTTIRAFGVAEAEGERFAVVEDQDRQSRLQLEIERILPSVGVRVLATCGVAVMLVLGGQRVAAGQLTPSGLVAFVVALGLMASPLARLAEVWSLLQRSLASLERVEQVLSAPTLPEPTKPLAVPAGPLSVSWEGVTVHAESRALVQKATLTVGAGRLLALVGATGAGKTTLLRLAHGARRPDEGRVVLGGVAMSSIGDRDLRSAVAVVHQEGFLFARSLLDNVRLARPRATTEEVRRALELAGLPPSRLEERLPSGLLTVLDERAQRLSGGERQRVCLARALLTGARVLLLDEPTSQVDPETTAALVRTLVGLRGDHTIVVVAHDPALALRADHVVVLDDGCVVEQGPPAALLAARGRLWSWAGEGEWVSAAR